MGVTDGIGYGEFPEQHELGRSVQVVFGYDTTRVTPGVIVRDDTGPPHRVVIRLPWGEGHRYILGSECQWAEG